MTVSWAGRPLIVLRSKIVVSEPCLPQRSPHLDLRGQAARHFVELWPHVEQEADAQAHDVESKLRRRGRDEAEALRKILRAQIRLADQTLEKQLSFEFTDAEREQREQRDRDRKHIAARRAALDVELEQEPLAIQQSYEVLRRRVEPIGLVYLRPTTR